MPVRLQQYETLSWERWQRGCSELSFPAAHVTGECHSITQRMPWRKEHWRRSRVVKFVSPDSCERSPNRVKGNGGGERRVPAPVARTDTATFHAVVIGELDCGEGRDGHQVRQVAYATHHSYNEWLAVDGPAPTGHFATFFQVNRGQGGQSTQILQAP
jgi:hypothetical protein